MTRVLAALGGSDIDDAVLAVAHQLAGVLQATTEAVHVGDEDPCPALWLAHAHATPARRLLGSPADALRRAAQAPDVAALVIGARAAPEGPRPAGHITQDLMTSYDGTLVVVPPEHRPRPLDHIVAALDGTPQTARALRTLIDAARLADRRVTIIHVLDPSGSPPFVDQAHHWAEAFAHEFRARHLQRDDIDVELRAGDPAERVIQAAGELGANLIALAWKRRLAADRAAVVRRAVSAAAAPVALVPIG